MAARVTPPRRLAGALAVGGALLAVALAGPLCGAPAPAPLAHHRGEVRVPDGSLGYETFGTPSARLPVVVINGGPGLSHAYMMVGDLWPQVARRRLVVVYDQRGTGASRAMKPGAAQTMAAQVADLEALRTRLGLQRFALVGDSFGGMIAMAYVAAHPQPVARLVLSDSAAPSRRSMVHLLPEAFPDVEAGEAARQAALAGDPAAAAQEGLRTHFAMIFWSPAHRDAYLAAVSRPGHGLGFEPAVSAAMNEATADLDLTPDLPHIAAPTLVITGRYDLNVAPLTAWRIAHAIPHARFVAFEMSGHLPAYEEPQRYQAVLESFLDAPP